MKVSGQDKHQRNEPPRPFKVRARQVLSRSSVLALGAARLYAFVAAMAALRWRLKVWAHASVDGTVKVIGWRKIALGKNVVLSARTWLNVNHRTDSSISLSIGDNTYVGCDNFFSVGRSIVLREYILTTSRCAFICSSHIYSDPAFHYAGTGTTADGQIYIGVNCFFGFGATVIGSVRIGHGCIIGAHSVVRGDVAPFSLAIGNPARVIKHFDFTSQKWVEGDRPQNQVYPAEEDYLLSMRARAGFPFQPISAAAARFGDI